MPGSPHGQELLDSHNYQRRYHCHQSSQRIISFAEKVGEAWVREGGESGWEEVNECRGYQNASAEMLRDKDESIRKGGFRRFSGYQREPASYATLLVELSSVAEEIVYLSYSTPVSELMRPRALKCCSSPSLLIHILASQLVSLHLFGPILLVGIRWIYLTMTGLEGVRLARISGYQGQVSRTYLRSRPRNRPSFYIGSRRTGKGNML